MTESALWYLYLVRCANGHLYTGVTTDVARRFSEHQSGGIKSAKYLRGKGPLTLMYQEQVGTRSDALKREIAVKKLSRAQKLALISHNHCFQHKIKQVISILQQHSMLHENLLHWCHLHQ